MANNKQKTEKTINATTGVVLKLGTPDTATVSVKIEQRHPIYKKIIRHNSKYTVHVEAGSEVKAGDVVEITPSRPFSKTKTWKLVRIVEAA
jgi:small subunit ribosomal protein S17